MFVFSWPDGAGALVNHIVAHSPTVELTRCRRLCAAILPSLWSVWMSSCALVCFSSLCTLTHLSPCFCLVLSLPCFLLAQWFTPQMQQNSIITQELFPWLYVPIQIPDNSPISRSYVCIPWIHLLSPHSFIFFFLLWLPPYSCPWPGAFVISAVLDLVVKS